MKPLKPRTGLLLAAAAGGLMPFAYAPFGWWQLPLLALAGLLILAMRGTARQAAARGYVFGLAWFGGGVHWIFVSCYRYGNMDVASATITTAALVAYLALFPALALYVARRLGTREGAFLLAAPGTLGLSEWLRSWLLTGFPWLAPGYSQIDSPLGAFAPLVGVAGVGLVLVAAAALLVYLSTRTRWRWPAAAMFILLTTGGLALDRIEWTQPAGSPVRLALVQGNVEQQMKWDPAYFEATLDRYRRLSVGQFDADAVIWPENAVPALPSQVDPGYFAALRAAAGSAALLIGMPTEDADGRYYNALVQLTGPGGEYRKRYLVPFGEYVPLKNQIGPVLDLLAVPMSDFSAGGTDQPLLQVGDSRVAASVCYEILFPQELRAGAAADWLINISNDAWFGDSIAPPQHLDIARMRARELGRPIARATNTGLTAIIDHRGRVTSRAAPFEPTVLRGEVVPRRGLTPFARFGEMPVTLLCLALCLAGGWKGRVGSGRRL
ncbi:apolipoprotein N-acyltransferase [Immundisolibacter sp.]|uniref:apolipoprotein N-acyltransferase n=1 Tax=Immundisolibacter sp. TaxID=1934948 RepID=UPI0035626DF9